MRLPYSAVLAGLLSGALRLADDAPDSFCRPALFDEGKLLATGGVSAVEGEGGGGLAAWALITGYGTRDGVGVNVHYTYVGCPTTAAHRRAWRSACSTGWSFPMPGRPSIPKPSAPRWAWARATPFTRISIGAKLKLIGDAVYDQDSWLPQIAIGLQHKENDRGAVIAAVGGKGNVGTDFYLAATKLFLAQSLLVDATLRETKANQFGILGFGGDKHDDYSHPVRRLRRLSRSAANSPWARSSAPSPAISASPRKARPWTCLPPISSTRIFPSPPPMPIWAIS